MNERRDPLELYDLERYLFERVHPRFHAECTLSAFDFFCIIVWKANRAKSSIAKRLLRRGYPDLEVAAGELTSQIYQQPDPESRLRLLMEDWGFLLPMASAILTVLYPEEFSVYDVRACQELGAFEKLGNRTRFDGIWRGYQEYLVSIRQQTPANLDLRDKDRWLWARSFERQLNRDLAARFGIPSEPRQDAP